MSDHVRSSRCSTSAIRSRRWFPLMAIVLAMFCVAGFAFADSSTHGKIVHKMSQGAKLAKPIQLNEDGSLASGENAPAPSVARGPAPSNDTCAGAIPLPLGLTVKGTTVDANDDYHSPATAACYSGVGQTPTTAPGRDVVYSFTAPATRQYSVRIVQQNPTDSIRTQNEVLYASDSCPGPGSTVTCLKGANRPQSVAFISNTGASNNQSEELDCMSLTAGQTIYIFFDDGGVAGTAANPGGAMSLEVIECNRESEPNNDPASANPFVCGILGTSDSGASAHCHLGTKDGLACNRTTPLDPSFAPATDLDCDPRCDVGPNAGQACTTNAFCNPVSDQGAVCAGSCFHDSLCDGGTNAGNPCTPVCVGGLFPGRYCTSGATQTTPNTTGCPGGGTCTVSAQCPGGGVCRRVNNEGDRDFYSLGVVPSGNKIFVGLDAKSANDYDWRMRITNDTNTLQFDDDDGVSRNGSNAPEIAGAVSFGGNAYVQISRSNPRASEPYELYGIVQGPLAAAQLEVEAGPTGNDIYYGWPGDVINANYVKNTVGGANGYVRGLFNGTHGGFAYDSDCFKFFVNKGQLMSWFGDGEPARNPAATTQFPQPVIYDAEPAGISNFIFGANARKNTAPNVAGAGLKALTPAVTSTFFQWRASYTGMLEVCYYDGSVPLGLGTPGNGIWAGSLDADCSPIRASGPGTTSSDVSIAKAVTDGTGQTGTFLTYTITVSNDASDIAQEVELVDNLPAQVGFVSLSVDDGLNGGNTACFSLPTQGMADAPIDCINTSMAPSSQTIYTVKVQVNNCIGAGVQVDNTASVTTTSTDTNPNNNSATATFTTSEDGSCNALSCDGTTCIFTHCDANGQLLTNQHCDQGQCVGDHAACDDHSLCTADSCNPASGCVFDSSQLGDLCDDGNPCTVDFCDPALFCQASPSAAGSPCDDGLSCTTPDMCNGQGACVGHSVCDDGNDCTDDFADETNACACSYTPSFPGTICNDGNACTGTPAAPDTCDGANHCIGGAPPVCNDNNLCTDDSCNPATGCVFTNNTNPCDDGNVCTTSDACSGGSCAGGPPLNCDDNNPCTNDSCQPGLGCVHTNNTNPCDDGNACTTGDTCGGGSCNPGGPTNCDDGNCCTNDSCNPSSGCVHTANTTPPVFTTQPSLGACAVIWPPNHGYVDFTVASTGASASAQCGIASISFASCSSSQEENAFGTGDGNSIRDCVYEAGALHVRAERNGTCSPIGRDYSATLVATDVCGNTATSNPVHVGVWHDRGHGPSSGTIYHSNGNTNDTRPGTNGTYGTGCGAGSACVNGTAHDSTDFDPEMEISQGAAINVNDLKLGKSGSNLALTWTSPTHAPGIDVTRFHIYRLDPVSFVWEYMMEVPKQTLTWSDTNLLDGLGHQYKVTAVIKP